MRGGPRRKIFPTLWRLNRQPPKFKLGCWKTRLWMNFLLSCVLKILKMNPDFININKAGPIKSKNNNTTKIVNTCLKCHLTIRLMNLISDQSRDLYRSHEQFFSYYFLLFHHVTLHFCKMHEIITRRQNPAERRKCELSPKC